MDEQMTLEAEAPKKRVVSEKVMENLRKAQAKKAELDAQRKKEKAEKQQADKRKRKVDSLKKQLVALTAEEYTSEEEISPRSPREPEVKIVKAPPPKEPPPQAPQKHAPKVKEKQVPKPPERLSPLFI